MSASGRKRTLGGDRPGDGIRLRPKAGIVLDTPELIRTPKLVSATPCSARRRAPKLPTTHTRRTQRWSRTRQREPEDRRELLR